MRKFLLGILIGGILFGGVVYAATYQANTIEYKENKNVEQALNDLYSITNQGDATAEDILSGKTALVQGNLITGTREEIKDEWVDITNQNIVKVNSSGTYKLYRYNNLIKLKFDGTYNTVALNSYTQIGQILDSKFFPKETVDAFGIGSSNGWIWAVIDSNGNITAKQSLKDGNWLSFEIYWFVE